MSPANDRQLDWAREELGLDATAGEAEARRAFLTQVAVDEFVPTAAKLEAFSILRGGAQEPLSSTYQEVERSRTKAQVEEFAERIFLYSPIERRKTWEALRACSADLPGAWAILDRLQPTLDLDFEPLQHQEDLRALTDHLRELFTLPPVKRAERRSAIIESCQQDSRKWERAAQNMASKHSNVAALDSRLIEQLSTWTRSEKVMRKPPRVKAPPSIRITKKSWTEDVSQHPWVIVVVLIVLANVGRLATTNSLNQSSRPASSTHQKPSPARDGARITEDVLNRLKEMQSRIDTPEDEGG
ncbi:MAG TPA: hypothetical protein P5307_13655, partial [Pirellulaceae bacterium]|nr:hypothetical protein [Pirellulaceae bacterium]